MDFKELSKSNEEQLERWELECIYRHLNMFIQTQWDRKENVQDACYGCKHYCSDNKQVLNPWSAFYKLANLSQSSKVDEKVIPNKQDNDHIYL